MIVKKNIQLLLIVLGIMFTAKTKSNNAFSSFYFANDTIDKIIIQNLFLAQEVGLYKKNINLGLPYDRLTPFFIKNCLDSLTKCYETGVFCFVNSFSDYRNHLKDKNIKFKESDQLLAILEQSHSTDTIKVSQNLNIKLKYYYYLKKIKVKYIYIGEHYFQIPNIARKNNRSPNFLRRKCKTFLIIDIELEN